MRIRTGMLTILVLFCATTLLKADEAPVLSLKDWAKKAQGRQAYGMYFNGKKAGWIVDEWKLGKHDGKEVFRTTSESYMATEFDGEKSVKTEHSLIVYSLEGVGEILFAEVKRKEDGKDFHRTVVRKGKKLHITTKQGDRTLERTVELPKDTLAHQRELEVWMQAMRKPGEKFTKYSVSWENKDINDKQTFTFKSRKVILFSGLETTVNHVEINIEGGKLDAEVFPDSKILNASLGGLMSIKLEKEADAKKFDGKPVDLLGASAVVVDKKLGLAHFVESLTLNVQQIGDFQIPQSHRQKITPGPNGSVVLELKRDFRVEKSTSLTKEEQKRYTSPTPRIQCDQEAIKNQAKKIVGDEKDPIKAANKLKTWVFRTLRKSYKDNADTSLEVLDNKAGDCTEHTLLFVALARAVGIPAREVGGLAYVMASKPLFGWHAWAEIHDGHQWVSVDPTWHQLYVDATHIKMSEGNRDLGWANVAGKLKMKVVKFETKK